MTARVITSRQEAESLVGTVLGESEPLVVTQDRVDRFADATGDHQWIHVDPDRAARGPFGGTIAHGYFTLATIPAFAQDIYRIDFGSGRLNYGVNKVRFPAPVLVGSTLKATATFVGVDSMAGGTAITTRFTIAALDLVKPACVAETIVLVI